MIRWAPALAGCVIALATVVPARAQDAEPRDTPPAQGPSAPETPGEPPNAPAPSTEGDQTGVPLVGAPSPDDRPLKALLPNLLGDLRRIGWSRDSAITFASGSLLTLAATPFDDNITDGIEPDEGGDIFKAANVFGGGYAQAGGAIGAYVLGRVTHHPRLAHLGADLIRAQALTGFVTHGSKLLARRHRPDFSTAGTSTYSFPSAHSSATWTSAAVLWRHLGWKVGVPGMMLASLVGAARVQDRQHFLSDVVFGATIGIASARTVTWDHGPTGRRLSLAPRRVPGGMAVTATLTSGDDVSTR